MKTAVLSLYQSYPPVCGAAVVTYNLARYLAGEKCLVQLGETEGRLGLDGGLKVLTIRRGREGRLHRAARMRAFASRMSREVELFGADAVILEGASWTLYNYLVYNALRRRNIAARLVYHAHNVEYDLRLRKNGLLVAALSRWAERRLVRTADAVYAVSDVDASRLAALYGAQPRILPNGVDQAAFDAVDEAQVRAVRERYRLPNRAVLFMGLPTYKPNMEALDFLIYSVFPKIIAQVPEARLVVTGGRIPERREWLTNPGLVDFGDLPAVIKACAVGVAPIFSGSGTRLKILEYMAARLPVVSTAKGAEGLDVRDGEHLVIKTSAADFAAAIIGFLKDPAFATRMGTRGREFVAERYGWPSLVRAFERDLRTLVSTGAAEG